MKNVLFLIAFSAALAAAPAFADGPKASDFKFEVSGVVVADKAGNRPKGAKTHPPGKRTVVRIDKDMTAVLYVKYEMPTNVTARIWIEPNCSRFDLGGRFGTSPSSPHSGKGKLKRSIKFMGECRDKPVQLKSVRISVSIDGDKSRPPTETYVCDAPVDIVYSNRKLEGGEDFEVLEPLPPPPPVTTTLLPGWTENLDAAKARAKKEGKLVLAYFLSSRPPLKADGASGSLDNSVLGSGEFVEKAGKSYVLYMCELDDTKQSWAARMRNSMIAFRYAARGRSFIPPEVAIVNPDGDSVELLDKGGWEGGADGFLAKIDKARKSSDEAMEAERKKREVAAKKMPEKKDSTSTPVGFTDNLDDAFAKAKDEGKLVYVCFSGSDWCGWCKRLEKEVFSDPLFVVGALDEFVLVFIDDPMDKSLLSDHAKAENKKLIKKYEIKGFPTALVMDGDGKKVGESGYMKGGGAKYLKHLKEIAASAKK